MIELKDILEAEDFCIIGAGASSFSTQFFSSDRSSRPYESDLKLLTEFADNCSHLLMEFSSDCYMHIKVKGDTPYITTGKVPLNPKGDSKCSGLCKCVRMCPTHLISAENQRKLTKKPVSRVVHVSHICLEMQWLFTALLIKLLSRSS